MALCACINCGNKVSSAGLNCPKCGYPVAKTLEAIANAEKTQQLREQQFANIEAEINYYRHEIQAILKSLEERKLLHKLYSSIDEWHRRVGDAWEKKTTAEKIIKQFEDSFPMEYKRFIAQRKESHSIEAACSPIMGCDTVVCPECGRSYRTGLVECPSCGWTENLALAETHQIDEQKRLKSYMSEISEELCKIFVQRGYGSAFDIKCSCVVDVDPIYRKRLHLEKELSIMENLRNEVQFDSRSILWDYIGKTYYFTRQVQSSFGNTTQSLRITFQPRGYAYLKSKGGYTAIEKLYAKEHRIYCCSDLDENFWYEFRFPYKDAIKLIDDLMGVGFVVEKIEEMDSSYLNGFEIFDGTLVNYNRDESKVLIPNTVKALASNVFASHAQLTKVVLSESVTTIGDGAFAKCINLKEAIIPFGVTWIGNGAFANCISLEEIVIPSTVTNIGSEAFSGCKNLKKIVLPSTVIEIGSKAFSGCKYLKEIVLPTGLRDIGYKAFLGCEKLRKAVIPPNVKLMGADLFEGCINLRKIFVSKGVKCIVYRGYESCTKLESIYVQSDIEIFVGNERNFDPKKVPPLIIITDDYSVASKAESDALKHNILYKKITPTEYDVLLRGEMP